MNWAGAALQHLERGESVALVTVMAAEGSTPRETGARMLVGARRLHGTIGGGQLEHLATDQAQRLLAQSAKDWAIQDYPLGPLLSQCCGGFVRLLLERLTPANGEWLAAVEARYQAGDAFEIAARFNGPAIERTLPRGDSQWVGAISGFRFIDIAGRPLAGRRPKPSQGDMLMERIDAKQPRLVIFGAGHVGLATARAFAPLPFHVEHYDPRPEAAGPGVATHDEDDLVEMAGLTGEDDFLVVLSHSHELDYRLVKSALQSGAFKYLGLIGSRTKAARFRARLAEDGVSDARLTCPIGIPELKGKAPEIIAVSIAAQLLQMLPDDDAG